MGARLGSQSPHFFERAQVRPAPHLHSVRQRSFSNRETALSLSPLPMQSRKFRVHSNPQRCASKSLGSCDSQAQSTTLRHFRFVQWYA